jgi:hypothetical protein
MADNVNNETVVREAAKALRKAIDEATAAGYRIAWPSNVAGLDTIAISETAAAVKPPAPAEKSAPAFDETSIL